jgi:hypothetical protein
MKQNLISLEVPQNFFPGRLLIKLSLRSDSVNTFRKLKFSASIISIKGEN